MDIPKQNRILLIVLIVFSAASLVSYLLWRERDYIQIQLLKDRKPYDQPAMVSLYVPGWHVQQFSDASGQCQFSRPADLQAGSEISIKVSQGDTVLFDALLPLQRNKPLVVKLQ